MKYCRNCGFQLNDEDKFCPKCGAAADDAQNMDNSSKNVQKPVNSAENQQKPAEQDTFKNDFNNRAVVTAAGTTLMIIYWIVYALLDVRTFVCMIMLIVTVIWIPLNITILVKSINRKSAIHIIFSAIFLATSLVVVSVNASLFFSAIAEGRPFLY